MTASELIRLIPSSLFEDLAIETEVDYQVKKLTGEVTFKLILFSMLDSDKLSLRVMEKFLTSAKFHSFAQTEASLNCKYNSIRDRICTINSNYFEHLFNKIFFIYNKELQEEKSLSKVDSTCVSLAAKLLSNGMRNSSVDTDKRFIKYTVALKGSIPASVKIFTEQSYISEDKALTELINDKEDLSGNVVVFDRGVQSRSSFDKFTTDGKYFITRSKLDIRCKTIQTNMNSTKPPDSSITLISDEVGFLSSGSHRKTQHQYRVIKATIDKSNETICFVTNVLNEDAYVIASWYKQRWEIEIFFKFIKQHLNVKHLVSRDENGIKVMVYMTMILAILIIAYKKINKIKGFKMAKLQFEIELENSIIKNIVILCGGNPDKAAHLFSSA
jgi:hypothetical protein